jgi:hypothetical protein
MKDLFDPTLAEDIKQRIMRLHPESQRRWGNMTLAQTLGSLSDPPLGGNLFFPPRPDSGGAYALIRKASARQARRSLLPSD